MCIALIINFSQFLGLLWESKVKNLFEEEDSTGLKLYRSLVTFQTMGNFADFKNKRWRFVAM